MEEANSVAMWFYPNILQPVTKIQNNCVYFMLLRDHLLVSGCLLGGHLNVAC